jgi:hypothetical protein
MFELVSVKVVSGMWYLKSFYTLALNLLYFFMNFTRFKISRFKLWWCIREMYLDEL